MHSSHVEANGLLHRVVEWPAEPPGSGAAGQEGTALLLHGFQDAAASWELVAPHLARAGLRVVAPDLRGFGGAPRAPSGSYYHFPDYVADVADIVDAAVAPGEPLFVVGHSMGGTVATMLTGTYPERVARLAVLEGLGPPDNPFDVAPDRMRRWIEGVRRQRQPAAQTRPLAGVEEAARRLGVSHPHIARDVLVSRARHLVAPVGDGPEVAWLFDPMHKTTSPFPFYAAALRAFASRATCPVLIVSGGKTGYTAPDYDERAGAFARVERAEIADAGHMMHWTKPDELGRALVAFWRGEGGGAVRTPSP